MHLTQTLRGEARSALTEVRSLKDRLEQENAYLRQVAQEKLPHGLTSHSPRFKAVIEEIGQVCANQYDSSFAR